VDYHETCDMTGQHSYRRILQVERILLPLLTAAVLVIGVFFYSDWNLIRESRTEVDRLHRVVQSNESLISTLKDLETGQRGYLLTGSPVYLEPYQKAKNEIPGRLAALETLLRHDAQVERMRRMRILIQQKVAEVDATLSARQQGGNEAALAIVTSDRGKETMDAIRRLSDDIDFSSFARLQANSEELERRSLKSRLGVLLGCAVMAGLLIAALVLIQRATSQREELMKSLDVSRREFEVTLTSIGDGVITIDRDGLVAFLNPVAAQLTGWDAGEAKGRVLESVFPIVNELTGAVVENPARQVLRERRILSMANHTSLTRRDGSVLPIDDSAAPIFDSSGNLTGVVMVFRDVSARQANDRTLRLWQHVFHHAGFGMMIITPGDPASMEHINPAFAAMHGYTVEELTGQPYSKLVAPELQAMKSKLLGGGSPEDHIVTETVHLRKDGTSFPALADFTLVRNHEGKVMYCTGYCSDISERKRAEEELKRSEDRYRLTADSLPQLIWTSRADGVTEYLNKQWHEVTGASLEQIGEQGWSYFLNEEDRDAALEKWNEALQTGQTFQTECRFVTPHDRTARWYTCRAVPVRDTNGNILRWFGSCTDTHEQRLAADVLRASKEELQLANEALKRSNADLEQFAYAASHDLQEPLRMIAIYSQLLKEEVGDRLDEKAKSYLRFAVEGAFRMEALLKDLLSYARAASPEGNPGEESDSGAALNEALANLAASFQDTGAEVCRVALPHVRMPAVHLVQVFQNLISNAVKYRKPDHPPKIHVNAEARDGAWVFSVADNGIGIDPQYQEQIFRIFGRLHGKDVPGTGIGLALCKKLVERSGGTIWVNSANGEGSTFYFTVKA
jgi:PAS domain S-box-containing protein